MDPVFYHALENNPVIAAIKNEEGLKACKKTDSEIIFILYGDICSIGKIIEEIKEAGKLAIVHIDLITGLSPKEICVDYIKSNTKADGIISTRLNIVNRGKELGLYTVYRLFIIDSMALDQLNQHNSLHKVDVIEILPGVMPRIVAKIKKQIKKPLITSGLISEKVEVIEALEAGAICVTTTNEKIWYM